ncbi:uncharacterized protein LOC125065891 [Vanessa atalanta]|uniref:uncharacterized protein LOC125065891 n=1 Tax=Vanessa atalanta TaxID=42275 RepID=UPI001FCDCEED|nr:uncharacterized protein LOC125065891 [Vanessa atalanta]
MTISKCIPCPPRCRMCNLCAQSCAGSSSSPSASGARAHASAVLSSSQVCIDQMTLTDVDVRPLLRSLLYTSTSRAVSVPFLHTARLDIVDFGVESFAARTPYRCMCPDLITGVC